MVKHPGQRVVVLADNQNIYHSAQNLVNENVDYGELLDHVLGDRFLIRAIAYDITSDRRKENAFFRSLRASGYEVKVKELKEFTDGSRKGDWDMGIAIDAIALSDKADVLVLVSGDGDFVDLVEMLQARGVRVEVVSFGGSTSSELVEAADHFEDIGEMDQDRILI